MQSMLLTSADLDYRQHGQEVGSVVKWLKRRAYNQHGPGSKPTPTILLCSWEDTLRHFPLFGGLGKQF